MRHPALDENGEWILGPDGYPLPDTREFPIKIVCTCGKPERRPSMIARAEPEGELRLRHKTRNRSDGVDINFHETQMLIHT